MDKSLNLNDLLIDDFQTDSASRANINLDSIGRQIAQEIARQIKTQVHFAAKRSTPRHFSANLLDLRSMIAQLLVELNAANTQKQSVLLTCQWFTSKRQLKIFATTDLHLREIASAELNRCIPLDNRYHQTGLRALITLTDPFEAMIVKQWVLRLGLQGSLQSHSAADLHISDKTIIRYAGKVPQRDQKRWGAIIAESNQSNRWLSEVDRTLLRLFGSEHAGARHPQVTVVHSFKTDPNQSPLVRLLIESKVRFRIVAPPATTPDRRYHSAKGPVFLDCTENNVALEDPKLRSLSLHWPGIITITQSSSLNLDDHPHLTLEQLDGLLLGLTPQKTLSQMLSEALDGASADLQGRSTPSSTPIAKPWRRPSARLLKDLEIPVFDQQQALTRAGHNPQLARELKVLLRSTLKDDLRALSVVVATQNCEQAQQVLHKMAGGLAMTGARRLEDHVTTARDDLALNGNISRVRTVILHAEQLLAILDQSQNLQS